MKSVSGGDYYYFGIASNICSMLERASCSIDDVTDISLHVNIDGVPLFKSTGGQFWGDFLNHLRATHL